MLRHPASSEAGRERKNTFLGGSNVMNVRERGGPKKENWSRSEEWKSRESFSKKGKTEPQAKQGDFQYVQCALNNTCLALRTIVVYHELEKPNEVRGMRRVKVKTAK